MAKFNSNFLVHLHHAFQDNNVCVCVAVCGGWCVAAPSRSQQCFVWCVGVDCIASNSMHDVATVTTTAVTATVTTATANGLLD